MRGLGRSHARCAGNRSTVQADVRKGMRKFTVRRVNQAGHKTPLYPPPTPTPTSTLIACPTSLPLRDVVTVGTVATFVRRTGILTTADVERIHEDTQALPLATFLQTKHENKLMNLRSHHMHESPSLVGIFIKKDITLEVILTSDNKIY